MIKKIIFFSLFFAVSLFATQKNQQPKIDYDPLLVIVLMVKNEAHIERQEPVVIETLKPYVEAGIDAYLIFDTGSTDTTIEVTQDYFNQKGIARGFITQEPFIDFATSRNRALELAQEKFPNACFMLMPDAEWYMHNVEGLIEFCKKEAKNIHIDTYTIRTISSSHDYTQQRLIRCGSGAKFIYPVHECINSYSMAKVPNDIWFEFRRSPQGNTRSAERWKRDLGLLKKAFKENPKDSRVVFYLAQTYYCLGQHKQAYNYYDLRVKLGGWDEERFVAQFMMGQMAEYMEEKESTDWVLPLYNYLKAFSMRPSRAEPLIWISKYYLEKGDHHTAFVFAQRACQIPYPTDDMLFVEKYFYDYIRWDVLSQCSWYTEYFDMGEEAVKKALEVRPDKIHLHENLDVYTQRKQRLVQAH